MYKQMKFIKSRFILLLTLLSLQLFISENFAQETKQNIKLEDITESAKFRGQRFRGGEWADDQSALLYTKFNRENMSVNLMKYDINDDKHNVVIDGLSLHAKDVDKTIRLEGYEYNNDKNKILIYTDSAPVWRRNTKGFYYIYNIARKELTPLASRDLGYQMFAKFSPDGKYVGFVRNRNMHVTMLETMEEYQITDNGSENAIINGTTDWVYEEELGLADGWSWSTDSKNIAFFQFDESDVSEFMMLNQMDKNPKLIKFKFPLAGEANSEVRIGVFNVDSKTVKFFETKTWNVEDTKWEYIARMGWTPKINGQHKVWMLRLNRDQNHLQLLYGNPNTNEVAEILNEKEETWVEAFNFPTGDDKLTYLDDNKHFIWRSEMDGYNHLYLFSNEGKLINQITHGRWEVSNYCGYNDDNGYAYFTAAAENPLERHLYNIPLLQPNTIAKPEKITTTKGTHRINMSNDFKYYVDNFSSKNTPSSTTICDINGNDIKILEGNYELKELIKEYNFPQYEFTNIIAEDGTELLAYILKPTDFDPAKKYPLLMYTYGGPGIQVVTDSWDGFFGIWFTYLVEEHDIIVAAVDNRGSVGRGKKFASANYKNLGTLDPKDQIAAAKHFGNLSFIDENRIGIWGWSYGGYNSALAMLKYDGPQTIKLGIAIAPGTDFALYDAIYTERYMSTPEINAKGYEESNLSNFAKNLNDNQHLLIIHSDLDDNAHFQGTMHFISALQRAKKQFSMMLYPGGDHSMRGTRNPFVFSHLFTMMTNFLVDNI